MGESIGTADFYCTNFNVADNWSYGQKTWTYTVPKTADYEASFTGGNWIPLVVGGNGAWEVRVMLNTLVRADTGKINNAPVSSVSPVIVVRAGFNYGVDLNPADADGDNVRCRYASASLNECGCVCNVVPTAKIVNNSCILYFDSNTTPGKF